MINLRTKGIYQAVNCHNHLVIIRILLNGNEYLHLPGFQYYRVSVNHSAQ